MEILLEQTVRLEKEGVRGHVQMPSWSRVLLKKLMFAQPVKNP
jgi:hypothetical protein